MSATGTRGISFFRNRNEVYGLVRHVHRNQKKDHAEALELQKKLQGRAVTVTGKAGENGKLFGSITPAQIAEALEAQHDVKNFDKRNIKLDETVKNPGNFKFSLKLYPGVQAEMTLTVTVA